MKKKRKNLQKFVVAALAAAFFSSCASVKRADAARLYEKISPKSPVYFAFFSQNVPKSSRTEILSFFGNEFSQNPQSKRVKVVFGSAFENQFEVLAAGNIPKVAEKSIFSAKNGFSKSNLRFNESQIYETRDISACFLQNGVVYLASKQAFAQNEKEFHAAFSADKRDFFENWAAKRGLSFYLSGKLFLSLLQSDLPFLPDSVFVEVKIADKSNYALDFQLNVESEKMAQKSLPVFQSLVKMKFGTANFSISAANSTILIESLTVDKRFFSGLPQN